MREHEPIDDSTFAYPLATGGRFLQNGMTIREQYAGMAMQGLLAAAENGTDDLSYLQVAEDAVNLADALIACLNVTPP